MPAPSSSSSSTATTAFARLVAALRQSHKTVVTVEQCCGGTISSGLLAQPGASRVCWGGVTAYNTRRAKAFLLNQEALHQQLTKLSKKTKDDESLSEAEQYIQSKLDWTAQTSVAFCKELESDYAIAEGGASGPTFRPKDLTTGFAVVAVAGRQPDGSVALLEQEIVRSTHNDRQRNMRLFANAAAQLALRVVTGQEKEQEDATIRRSDETEKRQSAAWYLQLDRATHLRADSEALSRLENDASTRFVVLRGGQIVVRQLASQTELALLNGTEMREITTGAPTRQTFLGIVKDDDSSEKHAVFGVDLLGDNSYYTAVSSSNDSILALVDTRTTAPLFPPLQNELALHATALAQWQRRTPHCSLCGGTTEFVDGGTCCQCQQCRAKSWPRQDPSMIALISSRDGQRVLLARSPRHPPKLHTVLAGFVEAGEPLEAAVARECFEETGVRIDQDSVRYVGSQPWPFPQSCMIGFAATADDDSDHNRIVIDEQEILSAAWFDRSQVARAAQVLGATMQAAVAEAALARDPSLPLLIPPKGVIARRLIDLWLMDNDNDNMDNDNDNIGAGRTY